MAKRVKIGNTIYNSLKMACDALGLSYSSMKNMKYLKGNKFTVCKKVEIQTTTIEFIDEVIQEQ